MSSNSWAINELEIAVEIRSNFDEKFYLTEFILRFIMPQISPSTIHVEFRFLERLFMSTITSLESFKTDGFRDATDEERMAFGFTNQNIQPFYTLDEERKEFIIWLRIPRLHLPVVPVPTNSKIHFSLKEDQIRFLLETINKLKNQGYKEDERGIKSQFE
jgi:hypothetical protein